MITAADTPPGQLIDQFSNVAWPVIPFPAAVGATASAILVVLVLSASRYFDTTGGLLTLSIMVVMAFIQVVFASLIYNVPQTPTTEILVGALATSLGAIIAYWMSHRSGGN